VFLCNIVVVADIVVVGETENAPEALHLWVGNWSEQIIRCGVRLEGLVLQWWSGKGMRKEGTEEAVEGRWEFPEVLVTSGVWWIGSVKRVGGKQGRRGGGDGWELPLRWAGAW
jgi:hypothetical protein